MAVSANDTHILRTVRAPKTAELIADDLRAKIVRGVLKKDDVLPSEQELVKQFGVSRPTLREAFRILENESLIVVRRGSRGGVIVSSPSVSAAARNFGLMLQMQGATLSDIAEARKVFEPVAVAMLTKRHVPEDLAALRNAKEKFDDSIKGRGDQLDFNDAAAAALQFHDTIMERSGNITMALLAAVLHEILGRHMASAVRMAGDGVDVENEFRKSSRAYAKLLSLIESGDAVKAEQHWRRHMDGSSKRLLGGPVGQETVIDLYGETSIFGQPSAPRSRHSEISSQE